MKKQHISTVSVRSTRFFLASCALSSCLVACGGGGSDRPTGPDKPTAETYGSGGAEGSWWGESGGAVGADDCENRPTQTVTIGKEIWHSGLRVALGSAVLTPASAQCNSGELVIDAEFVNRGREAAEFPARVLVNSNGTDYEESRSYGDRPSVPGQRTGKSVFRLKVDSEFDLNSATLVIGDAGVHQAVVPLGPSSPDKFVSLVVPDLPISGSMSAGDMVVKFDYAWLRADEPWSHETLPNDEMNLSIGFSATCDVWHCYLGLGAFSLTLPDGTSVAADDEPIEVWTTSGTTIKDLSVLFTIESPPEGKYVLHMKGDWGESTDEVEAEFPFTIERQPTFSGI